MSHGLGKLIEKNYIFKSHWCPSKAKIFNKSTATFKRRKESQYITRSRRMGLFRLQVSVAESVLSQGEVKLLSTFWRWKKFLLSLPTLKKATLVASNLSVLGENLEDQASGLTTIAHLCCLSRILQEGLQVWLAPACKWVEIWYSNTELLL